MGKKTSSEANGDPVQDWQNKTPFEQFMIGAFDSPPRKYTRQEIAKIRAHFKEAKTVSLDAPELARYQLKGWKLLQEISKAGRPPGSADEIQSDEEFVDLLRVAYQKRLDEGYSRPTQLMLAQDLFYDSEDTIQRRLKKVGLTWKAFQNEFSPRS